MTVLKTIVGAAFVITSAGAMAEGTYPSEHMSDTVSEVRGPGDPAAEQRAQAAQVRNEVTARPSPVAPAAPADPKYRTDRYPYDTGWMRAAEAQRARGGDAAQAAAEISQRPTPVAPAAPADPKYVPQFN